MTSNFTCRPARAAPPAPSTVTTAVPFWPEQIADVPQSLPLGVIVSELRSGAARTVTAAVARCPEASWIVTSTAVSPPTLAASSTTVDPGTACATGRTVVFDDDARYGGTPPVTVSVDAIPEYAIVTDGTTVSATGCCALTLTVATALCPPLS